MPRVAIVIVTHNSAAEIGACLDALAAHAPTRNRSGRSRQCLRRCHPCRSRAIAESALIANPANAGFAAAVNQGVRATTAPLVLLLNPDAHLVGGLDAHGGLFRRIPAERAPSGGMLIGDDGAPQRGFMARNLPTPAALIFEVLGINRLWPRNPVNWHYRCLGLDHDASVTGRPACRRVSDVFPRRMGDGRRIRRALPADLV